MKWKRGVLLAVVLMSGSRLAAQESAQDNVVVILDASGSMKQRMRDGSNQTRMQAAQAALVQVMRQVPKTTQVGLLVFGPTGADVRYPLGPLDQARFESEVNRLSANGGTPLGRFMQRGADLLLQQRAKQRGYGTYRLLIVTDGEANDAILVEQFAPDILARGIIVDVIGVDMAATHTLAKRVQSYRRADSAEELRRSVSEVFAEVGTAKEGTVNEEVFATIAALPDGMGLKLIETLHASSINNEPISGQVAAVAPNGSPPGGAQGPPEQKTPGGGGVVWVIVIVLAVVVVFSSMAGKGRKLRGRM